MLHAKKNRIGKNRTKRETACEERAVPFFAVTRLQADHKFFLFKRTKIPLLPSNHCNDQKVRTLLQGENL